MKQIQHHLQKYIFLSDFEYFERKKDYVFLLTNAMVMSNIHKLNFFLIYNIVELLKLISLQNTLFFRNV